VVAGLEVDYVRVKDKLSELQTRLSKVRALTSRLISPAGVKLSCLRINKHAFPQEGLRAAKAELALTKARKVRGSLFAWKRYLN